MRTVLFVNHRVSERCGVYQQGVRHFQLVKSSTRFNFVYAEVNSFPELVTALSAHRPAAVILNFVQIRMPWFLECARLRGVIRIGLIHNVNQTVVNEGLNFPFDYFWALDPSLTVDRRRWFSLERPVLCATSAAPVNPVFTMGSSGFFFRHKNFDKLVVAMRTEFDDACIRIHCPIAEFQRDEQIPLFEAHVKLYHELLAGTRLSIQVSTDFLSEPELLAFLQSNDANALFYDRMEGNGVSSALDLLISARRPIVLTDSDQFRHVKGKLPFYPNASIRQILALGTSPVEELYRQGQDFLGSNERALEEIFAFR